MHDTIIPIVTIDGPSGVGKGTISMMLAKELGWNFLDSGALYRCLAYCAEQQQLDLTKEEALANLALNLPVRFVNSYDTLQQEVYLHDKLVNKDIRSESCGKVASQIASFPKVRAALLASNRAFARAPGLVADGRDMGTVVFPKAKFKFFFDASVAERAKRRYQQLKTSGLDVNLDTIIAEIAARDLKDRERVVAPMRPAEDAIIVDTTQLGIAQVFAKVMQYIKVGVAAN